MLGWLRSRPVGCFRRFTFMFSASRKLDAVSISGIEISTVGTLPVFGMGNFWKYECNWEGWTLVQVV